ncbi:type II toxin-antitoxin system CcdA family antitoxin [Mesorhizobium sp.]|nr:type II toxin-antitoxin system CcdA family antitoxin [Mesorhizobium sp.]
MRKIAANAVRQPANLSIDSQLMKEAKGLNVNVSRAAEAGIAEAVAAEKTRLWKLENRATMDAWNGYDVFAARRRHRRRPSSRRSIRSARSLQDTGGGPTSARLGGAACDAEAPSDL